MNERSKKLAEQAGIKFSKNWGECYTGNVQLERFAELVRQDEREACAKVCDDWLLGRDDICEVAKTIRARSKHD